MLETSRRILAKENAIEIARLSAETLVNKFENLEIGGKIVKAPYWKNFKSGFEGTCLYYVPKGGKLSPQEIVDITVAKASEQGQDLNFLSGEQLGYFMRSNGVGVDCSGFAYQISRTIYESLGGVDFDHKIIGKDGAVGITRVNAWALTSEPNSFRVEKLTDIKPGDLIRSFGGSHAVVVLGLSSGKIQCVHPYETGENGVQRFNVTIEYPSADIFNQKWDEMEEPILKIDSNDGVWRLKILEGVYSFNLLPR